jgi:hypothetical protein
MFRFTERIYEFIGRLMLFPNHKNKDKWVKVLKDNVWYSLMCRPEKRRSPSDFRWYYREYLYGYEYGYWFNNLVYKMTSDFELAYIRVLWDFDWDVPNMDEPVEKSSPLIKKFLTSLVPLCDITDREQLAKEIDHIVNELVEDGERLHVFIVDDVLPAGQDAENEQERNKVSAFHFRWNLYTAKVRPPKRSL